jgi:hypothetical protein
VDEGGGGGGGLGDGTGIGFTLDFDLARLTSPPRRVEVDEEEDSRTGASPRELELVSVSSVNVRDTSGRLRFEPICFGRDAAVEAMLGEADDMEVGVELMLNGPGE